MKPDTGTRLYVEAPLSPGASVQIDADRAHYLRDVLRLAPGAPLRLFNGRDGEWRAAIGKLTKSGGTLAVEAQTRKQSPSPDLWLVFAATKRAAIDLVAEKATELGVSAPAAADHPAYPCGPGEHRDGCARSPSKRRNRANG